MYTIFTFLILAITASSAANLGVNHYGLSNGISFGSAFPFGNPAAHMVSGMINVGPSNAIVPVGPVFADNVPQGGIMSPGPYGPVAHWSSPDGAVAIGAVAGGHGIWGGPVGFGLGVRTGGAPGAMWGNGGVARGIVGGWGNGDPIGGPGLYGHGWNLHG